MTTEKITELESKITSPINSAEKVDALNQLAYEIRNTDTKRAITLSKEAQLLSTSLNFPNGLANAISNEAFCQIQLSEYELAIEKSFEALQLFEEQKNENGIAQVHYNFGIIYLRFSDFENSLDSINKATTYYQKENNELELARCYFQLGNLYRSLNDFNSAKDYLIQSIEFNKKTNNPTGEGASLMGLGVVYLKTKEYDKAHEYLSKATVLQEQLKDWRGYAASLNNFIALYLETEKYEEAENTTFKGIKVVVELGTRNGICRFLLEYAKIYFRQKKIDLAEEKAIESLDIATKLNLRIVMAPAHLLLSEIYQLKGDYKKALDHYQLFSKVNDEDAKTNAALKAKTIQFVSKIESAQKEAEINHLKNVDLKNANDKILEQNIALQDTIDELTKTKISRKAITLTLLLAIVLFLISEGFIDPIIERYSESLIYSMLGKLAIALMLKPVEGLIERILLSRVMKRKRESLETSIGI